MGWWCFCYDSLKRLQKKNIKANVDEKTPRKEMTKRILDCWLYLCRIIIVNQYGSPVCMRLCILGALTKPFSAKSKGEYGAQVLVLNFRKCQNNKSAHVREKRDQCRTVKEKTAGIKTTTPTENLSLKMEY